MILLDGIGIGKEDYQFNPFFKYNFKTFKKIFGSIPSLKIPEIQNSNKFLFPADAVLGVNGLPQSGTGQASIYTGENIPKLAGKHYGPFPYSTSVPVLLKKHLLIEFKNEKNGSYFANGYPKVFFDYINSGKTRLSVTPLTLLKSGIEFNSATDVRKGTAITAELTNERWNKKLNYKLPVIKPRTAAKRLLKISSKYNFTLYEYYLSDHLGHRRLADEFEKLFTELDEFLFTLLTEIDGTNLTLIICSDHGNLEDLSVKTHTRNPALTITAGRKAESLSKSIKKITDIKPAIIKHCK